MATLDFERITAEKVGAVAWLVDQLEQALAELGTLDRAARERIDLLRGEIAAGRWLSFRAADALDLGYPLATSRQWRSWPGRGSPNGLRIRLLTFSASKGSAPRD